MMVERYDYVIVGSGSSGSVVAARLSEDPSTRVLVLEAGGSDRTLRVLMPGLSQLTAYGDPRLDWRFTADPDPTRGGQQDYMPRGKVLGGTSSINAMSYVRGTQEDFDEWAALGCAGWDFESVLPFFRKSETFEGGANRYRGDGGPLSVSHLRSRHPLSEAFLEACVNAGMLRLHDYNAPPREGIAYVQATQRRGWRHSAYRAYLRPVLRSRPHLAVRTHAHVRRVLFEGTRAAGVEYAREGRTERASAARAVILSAGTFGSPQLLMLSGVGPEEHLREHGIAMVHDLPGVGENLQDHAGTAHTVWVNRSTYNVQTRPWHYLGFGLQWLIAGRGPASTPMAQVAGLRFSDHDGTRSRVQYLFTPGGFELGESGPTIHDRPAVTGLVNVHRPCSAGWVRLRSADPFAPPSIQPNLFGDERDVETLLDGHKFLRTVFATGPMARYVVEEHRPGPAVQSDDEWRAFIRETGIGVYHPAGTCKMGHDRMAVVDDRLRVRGLEGLYVVDASIMPFVVSANLNGNCIMIGEKASDMLRSDR